MAGILEGMPTCGECQRLLPPSEMDTDKRCLDCGARNWRTTQINVSWPASFLDARTAACITSPTRLLFGYKEWVAINVSRSDGRVNATLLSPDEWERRQRAAEEEAAVMAWLEQCSTKLTTDPPTPEQWARVAAISRGTDPAGPQTTTRIEGDKLVITENQDFEGGIAKAYTVSAESGEREEWTQHADMGPCRNCAGAETHYQCNGLWCCGEAACVEYARGFWRPLISRTHIPGGQPASPPRPFARARVDAVREQMNKIFDSQMEKSRQYAWPDRPETSKPGETSFHGRPIAAIQNVPGRTIESLTRPLLMVDDMSEPP